ncbi:YihY family inner membrane protein [Jatrophihabitans sp. GAS493]|uniref:YihY/virulence factor BrkB family protein n=1 Tax=Jatrophihabitans sp. GAS493 TaxID=1907575 RepID=UPI000BB9B3CC|nr:YihY/virulence factor BrkB family protein [Jatrophihabitans sp. GAS493]SOD70509.1 YihY family inner membrane protein [Jatrophihabitans sp. GAS493]
MGFSSRLDGFQRRHPAASFPLAVVYKYFDDFGPYLAALLTYYGFISLFPLLLLLSTVLSIVLVGHPGLQHDILNSALSQFPVVGDQLGNPQQLSGGTGGLIIGIIVSLYGGLGAAQAGQYAMNTAWRVPRNTRPNPFRARGRSLVLLTIAGVSILITTGLSTIGGGAGSFAAETKWLAFAGSVVLTSLVFVLVFRIACARRLSTANVAPGAIIFAVCWPLLQYFSVIYVTHVVKNASATNGVFAIVLGLLAFLYIGATITVICVEINVVRVDRLYPRSLLTPFTDAVVLTAGDRDVYTGQATAQRSKGFQEVDVTFDQPDQSAEPAELSFPSEGATPTGGGEPPQPG